MRRREFLTLLGAAAAWPAAVIAQRSDRPRAVAIMPSYTTVAASGGQQPAFAFARRLAELGWEPGRNIVFKSHLAADETRAVTELMSTLARQKIDVVLVLNLQMAFAVRSVVPDVPIVVAAAGDPVGAGAARSLARPGGTITGMSLMAPEVAAKRVERLIELLPQARRIAILHNPAIAPTAAQMLDAVSQAGKALGLALRVFAASTAEEIDPAFAQIADWNADGVVVLDDSLLFIMRAELVVAAERRKLPLACPYREMARAGCLFSYSASVVERFVRSADYLDKILRGANPGDLPFEQPAKFEFIVNLKSAKALGIVVPETLLAIADEVLE